MPYTFLGPADRVSHRGERPISFVWRLRGPMPAGFFREARVATGQQIRFLARPSSCAWALSDTRVSCNL